jgi:LPXTG-motif cell wall-anchored protein
MIQRPQSLFFLAIIAICFMLLFSDTTFFEAKNNSTSQNVMVEYDETKMTASDGTTSESNTYLLAFISAIALLAGIALILFKNRKVQSLISSINYLLILGLIIMMYMYSMSIDYFEGGGDQSFTFYALLPMSLLFFNFLALRGIKKDNQLIRSMDRLR